MGELGRGQGWSGKDRATALPCSWVANERKRAKGQDVGEQRVLHTAWSPVEGKWVDGSKVRV